MTKAKAIYHWWKKLPIWVRVPLSLVLLVALVVFLFERGAKLIRPPAPNPYRAIVEARSAQSERSSETLRSAVDKADKKYEAIKKELSNEEELREFEAAVAAGTSIDRVDELIAKYRESYGRKNEIDD